MPVSRQRTIWPWRDWVINALNSDLPFDRFTIEQLAGDMLPNATRDQRVATGFHRNTMLNEEGGIDPLEFRFHAMNDRVATLEIGDRIESYRWGKGGFQVRQLVGPCNARPAPGIARAVEAFVKEINVGE